MQRDRRAGAVAPPPDVNPDHAYLLAWFWDLSSTRSEGFCGPNPLSLADIAHWSSLTGTVVLREEIAVLRRIDQAYVTEVRKTDDERTGRTPGQSSPREAVSERPLTGGLFDALFGD